MAADVLAMQLRRQDISIHGIDDAGYITLFSTRSDFSIRVKVYLDQVMEMRQSCYLVLLSADSKTR